MQFYRAFRTKPLHHHPLWMILKGVAYQKYQVMLIAETPPSIARTLYQKGGIVEKHILNSKYHLIPITEEEAVTEIFLESH